MTQGRIAWLEIFKKEVNESNWQGRGESFYLISKAVVWASLPQPKVGLRHNIFCRSSFMDSTLTKVFN